MKKGDCIKIAVDKLFDNKGWLFCYAYVSGQGKLKGQRILHAWNEYQDIQDIVFDYSNGKEIIMRKEAYYKIAKIKEKDVTRQMTDEVRKLMFKTGTYGGWIK